MTNMNNREYSALMSAVDEIMEGGRAFVAENSKWYEEVNIKFQSCLEKNKVTVNDTFTVTLFLSLYFFK